jgi:hypothetical protein
MSTAIPSTPPTFDARATARAIINRLEPIRAAALELAKPNCGGPFPETGIPLRWHRAGDVRRLAAELSAAAAELEALAWLDWHFADGGDSPHIDPSRLEERRARALAAVAAALPGSVR